MKIISIFNNKGGVGKTTLTYHFAHILADMGKKVLLIDMDAQSNLSLLSMDEEKLGNIWLEEDQVIDNGIESIDENLLNKYLKEPRTIHFLLKSVEEGYSEFNTLPPLIPLAKNLDFISGRLTLFSYEEKISERWAGLYLGESLSLRTITRVRDIAKQYSQKNNYDFVIIDTSPSLNALNKVIISMADGFIIPCLPDIFSLYGIKNIGKALDNWSREISILNQVLSVDKKKNLPDGFVKFIGYVIYNAKKNSNSKNSLEIAQAHYNYARQIPIYIDKYISPSIKGGLTKDLIEKPIGEKSILYTHNTFPSMAQKHHHPMWQLPDLDKELGEDKNTISGNNKIYKNTKKSYEDFAKSFLERMSILYND